MSGKNEKEKKREIDRLVEDAGSFWKRDLVFIKKIRIKMWKAIFVLAFVIGALAALAWIIHLRLETRSSASVRIKSPLMSIMKSKGCVADGLLTGSGGDTQGLIEMINRSECAYLHRSIETWLAPPNFELISKNISKIKKKDMIYGMFLAEAIDPNADYYYPDEKRKFDFSEMCRKKSQGFWGEGTCKADMASKEYRAYLRYITEKAIDAGVQTFLFGQIHFQDNSGSAFSKAEDVVADMRKYAVQKNQPIVIGAQTNNITDSDYLAIFDYIEGGVGENSKGQLEDGPCFSGWSNKDYCWALLWHPEFSSRANDVILNFDWSGFKNDDMSIFAQMDKTERIETAKNMHEFFTAKDMGFMLPYLAVINDEVGCKGPASNYYAASNKYSCRDEDGFNAILKKAISAEKEAAAVVPEDSGEAAEEENTAVVQTGDAPPVEAKEKEIVAPEKAPENSGQDDFEFVSRIVPEEMTVGYRYQISIAVKNSGGSVWTKERGYHLGTKEKIWNTEIELAPGEAVAPGQTKTFTFEVFAPSAPGEYGFSWQMGRKEGGLFGKDAKNVKMKVVSE
ncbi:MAG: hypothetical protein A2288_03585 [Candidatus Moranbacteria bacterium RIFOXYA12_FULL_44_15]|nr:MAG: hypothetical protein A2288_03585 [Candidatus Moranbacteria bacterium RIFOXYA12_FULL_44_15]OGI35481.1 MAG: hypothetical protein A2259_02140 [Candidatus Moranbacteria bacterium RIFOXYA2_FULL_43_15]